jgi:hypothetical protein
MISALLVSVSAMALGNAARADVEISNKPTSNMSCEAGVCTAAAQKATLNVTDLANLLGSGDVAVKTGSLAKDIDVDQPLQWTSTARLTLDAQRSVIVKKAVTVAGTAGLTLTTNDGGSGGNLLFENKGSVTFWDTNSSLVINGQSYTLVKDIATLAADIAADPSGFYAVANSYDAKHERFDSVPIPTSFSGTFEGLGQSISHLKIRHGFNGHAGFFAIVDSGGTVRDIAFTKVFVRAPGKADAGVLAGSTSGRVLNVSVDGIVQTNGFGSVGGLVGDNFGTIEGSRAVVNVTGFGAAGGLVGASAEEAMITNSHATGNVSGGEVGGLAGTGYNITGSSASGSVSGANSLPAGGLVGAGSHIDQSFATGTVAGGSSSADAGGLAGYATFVSNCYSTGSVQAGSDRDKVGGLIGYAKSVSVSYSIGPVSGTKSKIGGLFGRGDKSSIQDYWDVDTSGTKQACGNDRCTGVTGLTTEEFKSALPDGFDTKIWGQSPNTNSGYPYLLANPPR